MKKTIFIIPLFLLLAFTAGNNRSVYNIPLSASAVCATDIDLDGDNDIVINHGINFQTLWGGIYIMQNDGEGNFAYKDSIFEVAGAYNIYAENVFSEIYPDIVTANSQHVNILSFDGHEYTQQSFDMGDLISEFALGDVDNDNDVDVVFISNNNHYWGILYNEGLDDFSEPEYHMLDYPPSSIACGNLDDIEGDDIIIGGSKTIIYFNNQIETNTLVFDIHSHEINIADINNDGKNDIVTFAEIISVSLVHIYENKGFQLFDTINSFMIQEGLSDILITDFNNDSLSDMLFLPFTDFTKYMLYTNEGGFDFSAPQDIPTDYYGESRRFIHSADMDGNGFTDIITTRQVHVNDYPSLVEILFNDGNGNFIENPLEGIEETIFDKTAMFKNYPNPFTTSTTFEFTIENESQIEISVYDLRGNLVKSLTNKTMKGGTHKIKWDGLNNASQACKPGAYIAYLKVNGIFIQSIKIMTN